VNPVLREGNSDRRAPKAVKTLQHILIRLCLIQKTVEAMKNGDFTEVKNP
jgi:monomeric isocitrate dehydrogenase